MDRKPYGLVYYGIETLDSIIDAILAGWTVSRVAECYRLSIPTVQRYLMMALGTRIAVGRGRRPERDPRVTRLRPETVQRLRQRYEQKRPGIAAWVRDRQEFQEASR